MFFGGWGGGGGEEFQALGMCNLAPKCTGLDWYKMPHIYQVENFAII